MKFLVADLERQAIDFETAFAPGSLDFMDDVRQVDDLRTAGRAELLKEHRSAEEIVEDIRVRGELKTRMELACARCLEPVEKEIRSQFDLIFRPAGADSDNTDRAISASETEIGYYEGDGLLLEDVLREQVLLALPAKCLCREDCKGLCPECGRNRNTDACECTASTGDPRWAPLKALRPGDGSQPG